MLWHMPTFRMGATMQHERHVRIFRNGRNQAVRIPVEFELPGEEVTIEQDGEALIIRPKKHQPKTFAELFSQWENEQGFPDVDDSDLPPDMSRVPLE